MFITKEEITVRSGVTVTQETLMLAHTMIETWVGKDEAEVTNGADKAILAKATMFQAIYLGDNPETVLLQAGMEKLSQNESNVTFDKDMFSPFMSPWSVVACKKLSWLGSRNIKTGPFANGHVADWKHRWYHE